MSARAFIWCQWTLAVLISISLAFPISYYILTASHSVESFDFASCHIIDKYSSVECVSNLQKLLNEDSLHAVVTVDGNFGPQTEGAVIVFQEDNGLSVDGKPGSQTFHSLNELAPRVGIRGYLASFLDSRLSGLNKALVIGIILVVALLLKRLRICAWIYMKPYILAGLVLAASAEACTLMVYGLIPNVIGFLAVALIGTFAEFLRKTNFSINFRLL